MASGITFDSSGFMSELNTRTERLKQALTILTDVASRKMENWAKENAKWEDRTGNARQGIKGESFWVNEHTITCALSHSVDYGIWLELANEKKYAILEEAIQEHKNELITAYERLVGG
jgi:hypothetical protein